MEMREKKAFFIVDDIDNTNIISIKLVVMRLFNKVILAVEMMDILLNWNTVPLLLVYTGRQSDHGRVNFPNRWIFL